MIEFLFGVGVGALVLAIIIVVAMVRWASKINWW